jgi:hypothetical protein
MPIGEGQGFLIGDELVLFSGFTLHFESLTRKTYSLNLNNAINGEWIEHDPIPIEVGLSHASHALDVATGILYVCGGYLGTFPLKKSKKNLVLKCRLTYSDSIDIVQVSTLDEHRICV